MIRYYVASLDGALRQRGAVPLNPDGWISPHMSEDDPAPARTMPLPTALKIGVRELRRRRTSIQRRGLVARNPERWRPRLLELALAIAALEAFVRSMPDQS